MTKCIPIIQTLYLPDSSGDAMNENLGFLSPEFNWMGWALSCLQLKQYYPNVQLYTNGRGYDVLINRLKLPYNDSMIVLNDLEFPPQLWAYPKLYVYSLQTGPFIHVDGDAFFWEPLGNELFNKPLIAQNMEVNEQYYRAVIQQMSGCDLLLPETLSAYIKSGMPLAAYNAGIIGGRDVDFFRAYTAEAFNFLQTNWEKLKQVSQPQFNMVFEQVLFFCMARQRQQEVSCYIKQPLLDMTYPGFASFADVPYHTKYIHLMGSFKTNVECCYMLAKRLRQNYPEYYNRIIEECKKAGTDLFLNCYKDANKTLITNGKLAADEIDWHKLYDKEKEQTEKIEKAFESEGGLSATRFRTNRLLKSPLNREESNMYDAPDSYSQQFKNVDCDQLDQILITALKRAKRFDHLLKNISEYFEKKDIDDDSSSFSKLISLRLRSGCFNNVFEIV